LIKKLFSLTLIIILSLNLTSCKSNKLSRYEGEFLELFNTATKIVGYTASREEFTKFSQLIYDSLSEYHKLFDIYNDYEGINNIKTINDNAGVSPVIVDKKIIDLLKFSKNTFYETKGKVNIAFGAVLEIWHQYRTEGIDDPENAKIPPMDKLSEASKHTSIDKLIIDETNSTVYLEDKEMSLDVGAMAKGYAVERVSEIAVKNGYLSGLISVGGNVRAIGSKNNGDKKWNVGIQNPDTESTESTIYTTHLVDLSLVTSGKYQRYYTAYGKQYHHIIDPSTLMPAEYFAAVTIVCKDSGYADALSTAVFNMPFDEGLEFINNLPNTEALWVLNNGEIKYSENFESFTK